MRLLLLLHLLLASACLADGMVFRRSAEPSPMPAQCAVLTWTDGVETLAIRTRFESSGGESAWVVPVPSVPELFEVGPGVVESAHASFTPRVVPDRWTFLGDPWVLGVVLTLLAHLVAAARSRVWTRVAIVAALAFGLFFCILPISGTARSASATSFARVEVLERRSLGAHEVAVVSSADPGALAAWLGAFGMVVPPESSSAIAAYCREGWCFVAAKLQDPGAAGVHAPSPVGMRFPTAAAVYPMRLTGTGNAAKPLDLELLVFGPGTAAAPGMTVESSARVEIPSEERWYPGMPPGESIRVSHTGVQALVGRAPWGTRLRGSFPVAAMGSDLTVNFGAWATSGREVYSIVTWRRRLTAGACAALVAAGVLTIPCTGLRLWTRRRIAAALVVSVSAAVGAAVWSVRGLPVVPTTEGDLRGREARILEAWYEAVLASPPAENAEQARGMFETALAKTLDPAERPTPGSGPDQYLIREVAGELEFTWVNAFGQQMVDRSWAPRAGSQKKP